MPRSRSVKLTASGQAHTGECSLTAISFTGFTAVNLYDGTDTTGNLIFTTTVAGVYAFHHELVANNGLYASLTGTGTAVISTI